MVLRLKTKLYLPLDKKFSFGILLLFRTSYQSPDWFLLLTGDLIIFDRIYFNYINKMVFKHIDACARKMITFTKNLSNLSIKTFSYAFFIGH